MNGRGEENEEERGREGTGRERLPQHIPVSLLDILFVPQRRCQAAAFCLAQATRAGPVAGAITAALMVCIRCFQ